MNGEMEKDTVNIHIIEHLIDYIKKINQSFTDIYPLFAFTNDDFNFYSVNDLIIKEMQDIFEVEINNKYFMTIYNNVENLINALKNQEIKNTLNEKLYIQQIYYNLYILYKMSDIFYTFINSNISYLIKKSLIDSIQNKIIYINTELFKIFSDSFPSKKMFLLNLDDKNYLNNMVKELTKKNNLYFGEINHNNYIFYELALTQYAIYSYCFSTISCLMVKDVFPGEFLDKILNDVIRNISRQLIKIDHSDLILKMHEFIKLLCQIESKEKLNEFKLMIGKSKIKKFLFYVKLKYFDEHWAVKFLASKKIEQGYFLHLLVLMLMKLLRCDSRKEIDFYFGNRDETNNIMIDIEEELYKE